MSGLFPQTPFIPATQDTMPACEWVMPTPVLQKRDYFKTCKALPHGRPDCLAVSTVYCDEGRERCVAAVYGGRAYLIHYEFEPVGRG